MNIDRRRTLEQLAEHHFELAQKETDPITREKRFEVALIYFSRHAETYLEPAKVENIMGDKIAGDKITGGKYEIPGQAGAVGPHAKAEVNSFTQLGAQPGDKIDLQRLAAELSTLGRTLFERANRTDAVIAAQRVQEAEAAANQSDEAKLSYALSEVGTIALSTAKELGTEVAALAIRRSNLKVATAQELARVTPWAQLAHQKYLVQIKEIDGLVSDRVWENLEQYGISLIRLDNYPPGREVLENIVKLIGFPASEQNDYSGAIKDINPAAEGRVNSGDTTSELGFHVDGTQDPTQPALLAFQYVRGAKLGANSRFVDAAGVLANFEEDQRYEVLTTLARSDAATFSKLGETYTGPVFSFSSTDRLMCRVRFDSVITVHESCRWAFDLLKEQFESSYYPTMYLPRDGDVVVFDNWRIMHARDEIYGEVQRHHRRVWIALPRHEHQISYQLGIRPIPDEIKARIKDANALRTM